MEFFSPFQICVNGLSHTLAHSTRGDAINSFREQFRLLCQKIAQWTSIKAWLANQPSFAQCRGFSLLRIENGAF